MSRPRRRHLFASLVLLTFTATAFAVERAPDGRGEVLLFPLVIADNGWDTYLNLRADPAGGQIVRLRFLDGRDGAVVNAFNVYLLPGENWGAAVTQSGSGTLLRIAEGSCVIADNGTRGGAGAEFPLDLDIGMVEAYVISGRLDEGLRQSNCTQFAQRWNPGGVWDSNPQLNLEAASGAQTQLAGFLSLVNVEKGLSADLAATALRNLNEDIAHTAPGDPSPNLAEASPVAVLPDGSEWLPESGEGIDAVAKVLSPIETGAISNEVTTLNSVGASTDWVVTFPLAGYREYRSPREAEIDGKRRTCSSSYQRTDSQDGLRTTHEDLPWYGWGGGVTAGRPEAYMPVDYDPVPFFYVEPFLCFSVNVVSFGDMPPVLVASDSDRADRLTQIDSVSLSDLPGWHFRYTFIGAVLPGSDGLMPVIAFRATQFINSTLEGGTVRANYLFLRPHEAR